MKNYLDNKWFLSILAGILLGLSFPPINLSFLTFPAFILLFHLSEQSTSYRQLARFSFIAFVIWNLIGTYWLMMATVTAGIAAILANSMLMTIPLCLAKFFSKKCNSPFTISLLQAAAWVSYEFLHHQWDLSWTWLSIGNAWANMIGVIQYISFTGHLGISFWVILSSALAYQVIITKQRKLAFAALLTFLIFPIWSFFLFDDTADMQGTNNTEVAIIQPNHDSYESFGGMSGLDELVDSLFTLTTRTITPETELIIWPENAIDAGIFTTSKTAIRIADSARTWQKSFVVGTGLYKTYEKDTEELYRGIYPYPPYQDLPYNYFNAALFVNSDGQISDYEKANLVPVVERIPFLPVLTKLDVFGWVNWGEIAGFGKGTTPDMLTTDNFRTPGLVCYDSVYPTWIREFVKNNATFLTIITNDGWWGDTSGHHQHFAYARLRAIEFNRWIARSANNGISGIIAPNGAVQHKTEYWVRTGFTGTVQNLNDKTFYTRFGNWLSFICLGLTAFGWIFFKIRNPS